MNPHSNQTQLELSMIKNYLLTAFRNVLRYKGFSLINIFGLSLSMSVCMVIIVVIQDQYSYDEIHTKKDSIYRVQQVDSLASISLNMASNPYALGTELRDNYALAENVVILNGQFRGDGIYNETRLPLSGLYANSEFFHVFDFKMKAGSLAVANSLCITILQILLFHRFNGKIAVPLNIYNIFTFSNDLLVPYCFHLSVFFIHSRT